MPGWVNEAASDRFHAECRDLFQTAGWEVHPGYNGACDTVTKGNLDLYLHPQSFGGVILDSENRLGADKCTGMYVREEDIFNALYRQLKDYVNEHYITSSAYKQKVQEFKHQIADLTQRKTAAWINAMEHYEKFVQGEISKEEFRTVQDIANQTKESFIQAIESETAYEKQYAKFRKLLSASDKSLPLSEIVDCIDKIIVDTGGKIVIKWKI